MSQKNKKSAKDIAFEQERIAYRREIKDLRLCLNEKNKQLAEECEKRRVAEAKSEELREWVERLLEFTEMSEEDLKLVIETQKTRQKLSEQMDVLLNPITRILGGGYFGL